MAYIGGFVFTCLVSTIATVWTIAYLQKESRIRPLSRVRWQPPSIKSRAVISFSIILPFSAFSFLFLTFVSMKLAQNLNLEGHGVYVVTGLMIPTFCFSLGFFYFRKMVRP